MAQLLTPELEAQFPELGTTDNCPDTEVKVLAKFFTPDSFWIWCATEYSPTTRTFFGLVVGFEKEFGYFFLDELQENRGPLNYPIQRDVYWQVKTLAQVKKQEGA